MSSTKRVLREGGGAETAADLDRAWEEAPTFALLPQRTTVSGEWVRDCLARLPDSMAEGHFALLTSGSTGVPKLVVGERARAERLAQLLHRVQASEPVACAIATLPLSYCYSFVNQWLWAREHGRRFVPTQGFARPQELRAALAAAEDAMLCLVGPQLRLFASAFGDQAFPGVTRVHFAGGPFPVSELAGLARRFPGARLFNNYGCAEAMPRLTVRPLEGPEDTLGPGDIGRPLPGVELQLDADGVLCFRSPFGALAYFEGQRLEQPDPGRWMSTGDLAECDDRGHWRVLGRSDQVFKRYGEKVSLARLLESVSEHATGQAAFYRERDRMGEEGGVLVLAPEPSEEELRAILRALRRHHPRTHWPLRIEAVGALPLLPNGKIDRAALPALEGRSVRWKNRV